jgi:PKD repeat protein
MKRALFLPACTLAILALATTVQTSAQTPAAETIRSSLTLPAGSVFELLPVHTVQQPTYAWSFMQGETFLQAGRGEAFRTRLIEPGNYLLRGEVRSGSAGTRHRLELSIVVTSEGPGEPPVAAGSGIVAETFPMIDQYRRIGMQPTDVIVRITPSSTITEQIFLDTDSETDTDRDGNSRNDQALEDSFFSNNRTPVHLWLTEPADRRVFTLTLRGKTDTEEEVVLLSPEELRKDDALLQQEQRRQQEAQARIISTSFGSGNVKFTLQVEPEYESAPLLVLWNFGDGRQSMLDSPLHRYAQNGTYTVTAVLRDLSTAEEVGDFISVVTVSDVGQPDIPDPPLPPEGEEEEEPVDGGEGWSLPDGLLSTIVKFFLTVAGSVLLGLLITLVFRFLRKGGIRSAVDRAESALVGTPLTPLSDEPPAPMALPVQDDEEEEESATEDAETPEPEPAPQPVEVVTPSWLQNASAPPAPQPESWKEPAATEAPAPQPPSPPQENGTVPSWLAPAPVAPVPEPEPVAAEPVEPVLQEQTPPPAPALDLTPPAPIATENAPSWLQQGLQTTPAEPAPAPESTPEPPAPATTEPVSDVPMTPAEEAEMEQTDAAMDAQAPTKDWASMTPEEKEKERKRQKRQRYRKNKREREREEKAAAKTQAAAATAAPVAAPLGAASSEPDLAEQETSSPAPANAVAPVEHPILPAEDDVKFVIGADSVSKPDTPPATQNPA